MKKLLLALSLALGAGIVANAQTEFRHISFDEAKAAAKAENKLIFVDFYTQWCGPCKQLAKNVFPQPKVGDYINTNFVPLKVDAENEEPALVKTAEIAAYPTLAVFDAEGNLKGKFEGSRDADALIAAIAEIIDPELNPEVIEAKYKAGDRTPKVVEAYARRQFENTRNYSAAMEKTDEIITEYFNGLSDEQKVAPENKFMYTSFTYTYKSPRVRYVLDNIDKFGKDDEEINKMLTDAFMRGAIEYFSHNLLGDAQEAKTYEQLKKDAKASGHYEEITQFIPFIENRSKMNDDEYLAYCDANVGNLDGTGVYYLVSGMKDVIASETPEQKEKISKFIRKHIGSFETSNVYSAAIALMGLENGH